MSVRVCVCACVCAPVCVCVRGADKLRRDLLDSKEETHIAIQEGMSHKQQASKLDVELDGAREQERMLTDQVHNKHTKVTCD